MARKTPVVSAPPAKAEKAEKVEKVEKVEKAVKAEKTEKDVESEKPASKKKPTKTEESVPVEEAEINEVEVTDVTEETEAQSDENPIKKQLKQNATMIAMILKIATKLNQDNKKLDRAYAAELKKMEKIMSKKSVVGGKKKRSGSSGLDKKLPIQTQDFRTFIEKNYQQLKDRDGNQIITELVYETEGDGSLLISRKDALKIITAYVKHHNLQTYEDKKRIKLDKTLQKLFPDFTEFYFFTIMKALSPHLKNNSAEATA